MNFPPIGDTVAGQQAAGPVVSTTVGQVPLAVWQSRMEMKSFSYTPRDQAQLPVVSSTHSYPNWGVHLENQIQMPY